MVDASIVADVSILYLFLVVLGHADNKFIESISESYHAPILEPLSRLCKLSQLMADHVLRHHYWHICLPIVHLKTSTRIV